MRAWGDGAGDVLLIHARVNSPMDWIEAVEPLVHIARESSLPEFHKPSSRRAKELSCGAALSRLFVAVYFFSFFMACTAMAARAGVQGDEACAVGLIVDLVLAKGGDFLIVKGIGAGHAPRPVILPL